MEINNNLINKSIMFLSLSLILSISVSCDNRDSDWINKENWYALTNNAIASDIGKTAKVKVNGIDHIVRLIGIDHDVDQNDNKLHTTWEFINLISDSEGHSLGYQLNDLDCTKDGCFDYPNSTLRFALCGQGNNGGKQEIEEKKNEILCSERNAAIWSETYKNKTILSMMPTEFTNVLKDTKRKIGIGKRTGKTECEFTESSYVDKLFLLTPKELGNTDFYINSPDYGTVYDFYQGDVGKTFCRNRVKNQVKWEDEFGAYIIINKGHGQSCNCDVQNYAGFSSGIQKNGEEYWLATALPQSSVILPFDTNFTIHAKGMWGFCRVSNSAMGVAPAFCI